MTFTPGGPQVQGTWDTEPTAVKCFADFITTHGSDNVTITLWTETDGTRHPLRTWTKDRGMVFHAGH
ncbi:hypothetical protein ACFWTC_36480 [Streptomyces sp. NPDC058619]|uniref:hypothetical protein n=1 Tax=unclassified Streptomyces TaxID=2593676 RepID=UPI00365B4F22